MKICSAPQEVINAHVIIICNEKSCEKCNIYNMLSGLQKLKVNGVIK